MKKTRKGITLVEVIVSIAVFTIISLALFSSIISMRKVVLRQEEYVRLEMVVHDINAYWDAYGDTWAEEYFEGNAIGKNGYLDSECKPTLNSNYHFIISFDTVEKPNGEKELVIKSIKSENHKYLDKNINCGVSRKNETP